MNCEASLLAPHEAVNDVARVVEMSRHRAVRSNAEHARSLARTHARARYVERGEGAMLIADEAVIQVVSVDIPSGDRSVRIDAKGVSPLEGPGVGARARRIEGEKVAIVIAQEAVTESVLTKVVTHDGSIGRKASAKSSQGRARNIECGDDAILIPQEAVVRIGPVDVESCDLPT